MENIEYKLTVKDFKSDQEVRWCPGCGDHAVLNAVQKAMVELKQPRENVAVISGIGCSSRFPYYMNTYGFHSIHGRASAIASGVKVANPKLHVWQITGDGDALAIGGNHFIHLVRRNIDINVLLFNNEIYGLTKGQYSPTSPKGIVTKSSPFGTIEDPFCPGLLVLGAAGNFFARTIDVNIKLSTDIFVEAANHKGTSVVEILQNCVIFNDGAHEALTDKDFKEDRTIVLKHGEPMVYGKNRDKGIVIENMKLKCVSLTDGKYTVDNLLVHDAKEPGTAIHAMLANMRYPDFPVALGVIRSVDATTYEVELEQQIETVKKTAKYKSVDDLLKGGNVWTVK